MLSLIIVQSWIVTSSENGFILPCTDQTVTEKSISEIQWLASYELNFLKTNVTFPSSRSFKAICYSKTPEVKAVWYQLIKFINWSLEDILVCKVNAPCINHLLIRPLMANMYLLLVITMNTLLRTKVYLGIAFSSRIPKDMWKKITHNWLM